MLFLSVCGALNRKADTFPLFHVTKIILAFQLQNYLQPHLNQKGIYLEHKVLLTQRRQCTYLLSTIRNKNDILNHNESLFKTPLPQDTYNKITLCGQVNQHGLALFFYHLSY